MAGFVAVLLVVLSLLLPTVHALTACSELVTSGWLTADCCPNDGKSGPVPVPATCTGDLLAASCSIASKSLSGTIPPGLGSIVGLTRLAVNSNKLTGTIPPELAGLSNLVRMELFDNSLTGGFPLTFTKMSGLSNLYMGKNKLTGTLPANLGDMVKLVRLDLSDNKMVGNIPASISRCTAMLNLFLVDNGSGVGGNSFCYNEPKPWAAFDLSALALADVGKVPVCNGSPPAPTPVGTTPTPAGTTPTPAGTTPTPVGTTPTPTPPNIIVMPPSTSVSTRFSASLAIVLALIATLFM